MIKKSVFEDEIVANMQQELRPLVKQASLDLVKAADYLNSAAEIFEEAGLTAQSDQIINILYKIAESKRQKLPAIQVMLDAGVSEKDFEEFGKGSQFAKAKINKALRDAGYSEHDIATFIGPHNVLTDKDMEDLGPQSSLNRILKMVEDPKAAIPSGEIFPGDEVNISSIASKHKRPHDPRKINDPHTRGLTPDKMVKNLLHHGTEFNMSDDGMADDLLNLEINDEGLEVDEKGQNPEMDFEDEI